MTDNPLMPKAAKVTKRIDEAPGSFTLTVDYHSDNLPGQFVQVSIPGMGEAPISIASHDRKRLDLNINRVGNLTTAFEKVKEGDTLFVRGPYGNSYPLDEMKGKNVVLVGGGCGVASLRGMVHYMQQHPKDFGNVRTFVGFRSHDLILFRDDLESWKDVGELNVSLDTSEGATDDQDAKSVDVNVGSAKMACEVGFVTKLIKDSKFDTSDTIILMCGPPLMIKFSIKELKAHGFTDEQIYVSAERLMYCGIGKCCHCMIEEKFTCLDGPVFRLDTIGGVE